MASNRSQCVLLFGGKQSLQYEMQDLIDAGEDMWHAYNLIRNGDDVTATTFRKVQKDSGGTSAGASERIKIKLTIKVEEVDFDAEGMHSSRFFSHSDCCLNIKPTMCVCAEICSVTMIGCKWLACLFGRTANTAAWQEHDRE